MFQTELHIALQSLASDWLTWLMLQITASGYYKIVIAMVITVMFGFNLRRGFLLFQIIAWTALASEFAKGFFGLPRPFFVDSRVACLESGWDTAASLRAMGGDRFLSLPQQAAVDAFRLKGMSFGFPSGHVSGAVAMWGGLAVVFRKRALAWLAPFMVALVAFTRLYLGVHFLADVLGGAVLGGMVLLAAWKLIGDDIRLRRFFAAARSGIVSSLPGFLYFLLLFILPALLALFSLLSTTFAGFYIGINAAFTLAARAGLPADSGSLPVRLARVALGGLLFLLLGLALNEAIALAPAVVASPWRRFLVAGLGAFLTLWGGLRLFLLLGLYRRETPSIS
ncbi:MAG: phosphatase PAP2 family protein [Acidobacteria bacterium]|jgi:membrane-associated phospholipid phosphatase|nr:phosphatase PAP2 family protein [Acidobacteriota bacterium]